MKDNTPIREAFIKSTINVMDTLCRYTNIEYDNQKPVPSEDNDIIGIMGINGNIVGSTLIIIPFNDAVKVVSRMTGMEPDELSRLEIGLGIAELLNIISGNAKTILSGSEFAFSLTVPRVITICWTKMHDNTLQRKIVGADQCVRPELMRPHIDAHLRSGNADFLVRAESTKDHPPVPPKTRGCYVRG